MTSSTITLAALHAEHLALGAKIAALQAQPQAAVVTITIAPTEIELQPGEHYAGVITNALESADHHLVLMEGEAQDISWDDAQAWAKERGGELPTRREQALLYANCKAQFEAEWHWSSESHETDGSYAWGQDFSYGYQYDNRKSYDGRARAVRRVTA